MKAIIVKEPGSIGLSEKEMPEAIKENEVLVRVRAAGFCGSDIHIFHGSNPFATYPRVIGHEFAGEIEEIGKDVTTVAVGDRIVVDPVSSCGTCYACRNNRQNVCSSLKVKGVHEDGGMQEYLVIPASAAHKAPSSLSFEDAALIEPFTIAAQSTSRGRVQKDDTVCVMGAGPIGLAILTVCKMKGAKVLITDINESRLEMAKSFGADVVLNPSKDSLESALESFTNGEGFNVVIDAVCIPSTFEQAVQVASAAGRVVSLGFTDIPSQIAQLHITKKELDIVGSRLHANKFPEVIGWVEEGLLKPGILRTHSFTADKVKEAVALIESAPDGLCKAVVTL